MLRNSPERHFHLTSWSRPTGCEALCPGDCWKRAGSIHLSLVCRFDARTKGARCIKKIWRLFHEPFCGSNCSLLEEVFQQCRLWKCSFKWTLHWFVSYWFLILPNMTISGIFYEISTTVCFWLLLQLGVSLCDKVLLSIILKAICLQYNVFAFWQ